MLSCNHTERWLIGEMLSTFLLLLVTAWKFLVQGWHDKNKIYMYVNDYHYTGRISDFFECEKIGAKKSDNVIV